MTRFLFLLALVVALGSPLTAATAKDLEGSWKLDADALWQQMKERIPAEHQEMAKAQMLPRMSAITFEIDADSLAVNGPEGMQEEAAYTVKSIEGEAITLETTANEQVRTLTATFSEGGQKMTMSDGKGTSFVLLRAGTEAAAPAAPAPAPAAEPAEPTQPAEPVTP